jgi:hypothetical protein
MNVNEARAAIEAILAAISDDELPEFDKVEHDKARGEVLVWWGGTGHCLGSAKRDGQRDPSVHRRSASWKAIECEMTHRADLAFFENGDSADGLKLARKVVTR